MTSDAYIKSKIVDICWREAHEYGGSSNMVAVGLMLRNRIRDGWMGGDWLAVMEDYHTHSAGEVRDWQLPGLRDPNFRDLLVKVDGIYDGSLPDKMTEGALYCADLNKMRREWFRENIVRKPEDHARIAVVGPVYFFR